METTTKIDDAVKRLASTELKDARECVDLIGTDASPALVKELLRVTRLKRRLFRTSATIRIFAGYYALIWLGLEFTHHLRGLAILPIHLLNLVALVIASLANASLYQKNLVASLHKWGDIAAVGPLAATLGVQKIDRNVVLDALTRLLPKMRASDVRLLTPGQRASLYATMKSKPEANPEFLIVLLKALEQIGDDAAIPHVERLAHIKPGGDKTDRVREAALACLPTIQERVRHLHEESVLLRPAGVGDELLRPVSAAAEVRPELLLRPTQPNESQVQNQIL